MDLKQLANKYFEIFSQKDLNGLVAGFDSNITLRDWENAADGINSVTAIYKMIFDSVETIHVTPTALYQDGDTVAAELEILINGTDKLLVTDIISFNNDKLLLVK